MASEITCSLKQIKQCSQMTPLCCVDTVGVVSRGSSFGGVNSSSSIVAMSFTFLIYYTTIGHLCLCIEGIMRSKCSDIHDDVGQGLI